MYKKHEINPKAYKLAVLCGGNSSERKVSIMSGETVLEALKKVGFQAEILDPASKEDWIKLLTSDFDIAYNALHGKFGEDGTIQSVLEMLNIPYTGPGIYPCRKSMNKNITKSLYRLAGLPTPESFGLARGDDITYLECVERLGPKFVIKPATEGSSVGAHMIHKEDEFKPGLEDAFKYDDEIIVESFIEGREFTVPVLGNRDAKALPVIEIVPKAAFYDFASKYDQGGAEHICPAHIAPDTARAMKEAALGAHKVLKADGLSRSDFMMDKDDNIYLIETNAIPGMTKTSLFPDSAAAEGMSYEELCTEIVYLGLERFWKI